MFLRNLFLAFFGLVCAGAITIALILAKFSAELPDLIGIADYKPLLVTEVFDRNNKKFGEFFHEKRVLTPYDKIPKSVVQAFTSAEDASFFQHEGLNYLAMVRAFIANVRTGRKAQGGSTITQQVARGLLLSSEKTYTRKIKEMLLARKMEQTLKKEEILYLYLNQIYLGQGAHGVGAAAQIYFRKDIKDLTVPEAAILAGLPQAPSHYSPIQNPSAAKERQRYVLHRMAEEGYISKEDSEKYIQEPVKLYVWQSFKVIAPYYLEAVRQMLVSTIGEEMVLDKGIKVYTSMDLEKQVKAQEAMQAGLREVDKRQGYRGPAKTLNDTKDVAAFLLDTRNKLMDEASPERVLRPDGTFDTRGPLNITGKDAYGKDLPVLPNYIPTGKIVDGIVTKVDDLSGLTYVRFAESRGIIDLESMAWARRPDANLRSQDALIKKPSAALKVGDVIQVRVKAPAFHSDRIEKMMAEHKKKRKKGQPELALDLPDYNTYALLELEQEPLVEGALVSIDQQNQDLVAMVGGYDFARSKFNRTIQASRQTGSSFKALVYLSALDKDYTPATQIIDAPVVYEEQVDESEELSSKDKEKAKAKDGDKEQAANNKRWKPKNDTNKFGGDVLFRTALIRSLNVPAVKVIEHIGVDWAATYSRRLGIFSPLNMDFTLALGSSSVTLYEMTRAFGVIGRLGRRLSPIVIRKVLDANGKEILKDVSMDERFKTEISRIEEDFEQRRQNYLNNPTDAAKKEPPLFFQDKDQLIKPQTAYVLTTILQGVIDEAGGTGGGARSIGRPAAGKTGTTSSFYDGWFIGYTADFSTGVWVGFDQEKPLGRAEFGAKTALPIWLDYMKYAHNDLPVRPFEVPDGLVLVPIDNETGEVASSSSKSVVRQAFVDGTEPRMSSKASREDDRNFYKEEMGE